MTDLSPAVPNRDLKHTQSEQELLSSLAARLVLQAIDNDFTKLDHALASIRQVLEDDYPHLAIPGSPRRGFKAVRDAVP